ncbi:hypothetical protein ABVT39_012919 [Epinephelus coioides]
MGTDTNTRTKDCSWLAFYLALLLLVGKQALAQIRYSVPEEVQDGTVVGNVAKDLGLDITSLIARRFRVVSGSKDAIFEVNQNNGALYVNKHIDREELCQGSGACLMELKILVESPLEIHYVVVEITDVNDHSPSFPEKEQTFEIDYTSKYLQEANYDGTLCHSIQYRSGDKRYMLVGPRMSIGSTIVPGSHANTLVLPDRRRGSGESKDGICIRDISRWKNASRFAICDSQLVGHKLLFVEVTASCVYMCCWITMGTDTNTRTKDCSWLAFYLALLLLVGKQALAQIRYSVPEEVQDGTVVGNVAKDLGLDITSLIARRFRVVSEMTGSCVYMCCWITMGTDTNTRTKDSSWLAFYLALLLLVGKQALAQIRYSVPEEVQDGTVVGNVAKDLGLDITSLIARRFRVVSESKDAIFEKQAPVCEDKFCLITMGTERRYRASDYCWVAFQLSFLLIFGEQALAELRYSIPEEMKEGTVVGNVAKDLGLDKTSLIDRRFRVVSGSKDAFFKSWNKEDAKRGGSDTIGLPLWLFWIFYGAELQRRSDIRYLRRFKMKPSSGI